MAYKDFGPGGFYVLNLTVPVGASVSAGAKETLYVSVPGLPPYVTVLGVPPSTIEAGVIPICCETDHSATTDITRIGVTWLNGAAGAVQHLAKTWTFVVFGQKTLMFGAG
jgi:hypothetical protein